MCCHWSGCCDVIGLSGCVVIGLAAVMSLVCLDVLSLVWLLCCHWSVWMCCHWSGCCVVIGLAAVMSLVGPMIFRLKKNAFSVLHFGEFRFFFPFQLILFTLR